MGVSVAFVSLIFLVCLYRLVEFMLQGLYRLVEFVSCHEAFSFMLQSLLMIVSVALFEVQLRGCTELAEVSCA